MLSTPQSEHPAGWSPDGKKILFTRLPAEPAKPSVFVMNADGSDVRRLGPGIAAGWSPDGARILYLRRFISDLFVMNADGSHKHRIALAWAADPDWR